MAGLKKKMKAKLDVSPKSEMDKKVIKWIEGNDMLKKAFSKNYQYMEVVELDPRKWKEKDIEKDLAAVARYELKLLDMKMGKLKAEFDKANALKQAAIIAKAKDQYDKFGQLIIDKVSLAIEEAASDKGDNAKALRDGKAAFAKMDKVDFDKIFAAAATGCGKVLDSLKFSLATGKPERSKAFSDAYGGVASLAKDFENDTKDVAAVVTFLRKTTDTTLKNKDAAPELRDFFLRVKKEITKFDVYDKELSGYRTALSDLEKKLKAGALEIKDVNNEKKTIQSTGSAVKAAKDVEKLLKGWTTEFKKIEKLVK